MTHLHRKTHSSRCLRTACAVIPGLLLLALSSGCSKESGAGAQIAAAPKHEDKIVTDSGYDRTPAERRADWLKASKDDSEEPQGGTVGTAP
jgi:hypothetical protein